MDKNSELDCYLFYMWNVWTPEECMELFGEHLGEHIWAKWLAEREECTYIGAPASLYANCDRDIRATLVKRAYEHYNK